MKIHSLTFTRMVKGVSKLWSTPTTVSGFACPLSIGLCWYDASRLLRLPQRTRKVVISLSKALFEGARKVLFTRAACGAWGEDFDSDRIKWHTNGVRLPGRAVAWLQKRFPRKWWGRFYIRVKILKRSKKEQR